MNNKKITIGISAIFIVAAIFIIAEKMSSVRPPEHRAKFFPALEERHITAIAIHDAGSIVRLDKNDGEWTAERVDAQPKGDSQPDAAASDSTGTDASSSASADSKKSAVSADTALVHIAIEKIVSLKKNELISDNPDNQSTFEVDDANKSFVEIYAGKDTPAGVLRIGKGGPSWNSNYVRLSGSDAVYLISGGLRQSLFLDIEQWRKKEEPKPESGADDAGAANDESVDTGE